MTDVRVRAVSGTQREVRACDAVVASGLGCIDRFPGRAGGAGSPGCGAAGNLSEVLPGLAGGAGRSGAASDSGLGPVRAGEAGSPGNRWRASILRKILAGLAVGAGGPGKRGSA